MRTDSIKNILIVAIGVCLVCSIVVSTAAVSLSDIQDRNKRLDKLKNILVASDLYTANVDIEQVYNDKIESVMVDMSTGEVLQDNRGNELLEPKTFDLKLARADQEIGKDIPRSKDIIQEKRVSRYMPVYLVKEGDQLKKVILPIYGKGLWSTLYGFLALENDLKTIGGITFYQHGETPGLGGEVDNARWKASWKGKTALNESGEVMITVLKGQVNASSPQADHQISGLSGATITTRGVDKMMTYWLSEAGYGTFLEKLRMGEQNG